jgi:hypothetical protein
MEIILNDSVYVALEPCEVCCDLWAKVEHGSKYPIPPGGDITEVGNVELTIELIANSLQDLEIWYSKNKQQEVASAYTTKYMKVLGISGRLADGLIKSLGKGESLVESSHILQSSNVLRSYTSNSNVPINVHELVLP